MTMYYKFLRSRPVRELSGNPQTMTVRELMGRWNAPRSTVNHRIRDHLKWKEVYIDDVLTLEEVEAMERASQRWIRPLPHYIKEKVTHMNGRAQVNGTIEAPVTISDSWCKQTENLIAEYEVKIQRANRDIHQWSNMIAGLKLALEVYKETEN